jgi:transglutaminase-like putative cysteine protease
MRQATDWRVVALGGALFGGLMILSALLFVTIPRFQLENGLFLDRFITKKARSGFSDHIKFGEVSEILQDNSVALSVDVSDRTQIPASPYWRMLVLDEYRDGGFRLSTKLRAREFPAERTGTTDAPRYRRRSNGGVWTFYLESGISRYLPLLGPYEWLSFGESHTFRSSRTLGLVALRDDPVTMVAYRVGGMLADDRIPDASFGTRLASPSADPDSDPLLMLTLSLEAPDRSKIDNVIAEITGKRKMAAPAFATAAIKWLGDHHEYSLHPVIPAGEGDPLVRWLTSRESGHCELFAGSMVVLARSAGVPARVVTGFRGGSWNGYSNNFTLRNSDAHAWCEIFDAGTQTWTRVDPTPGLAGIETSRVQGEGALARRSDRSWKARLESLRVFWYRQIVSFDQRSQIETFNAMKAATDISSKRLRAALDRLKEAMRGWTAQPWDEGKSARVAQFLVLITLGLWLSRRVLRGWTARRWQGREGRKGDLVRMEAGKWLMRLKEIRAVSARDRTKDDVIERLEEIRYGRSETWRNVAGTFACAREVWRARRKWTHAPGRLA